VAYFAVHRETTLEGRLVGTPRRFAAVRRFGRDRSEADMPRGSGAGRSDENDPEGTLAGPKSRTAASA